MRFIATADTDIGTTKEVNQDSVLIKHGDCAKGEVLLAVICDGMGGLSKGEVASATVIRTFADWFDAELPFELEHPDLRVIGEKWGLMLKDLNVRILAYGNANRISLGTTFTGILFVGSQYVIVHVGDTRAYYLGSSLRQLTEDQTFVAREVKKGTMSAEQARTDKRRNMLLQCIGASEQVEPEILVGKSRKGAYLLCSDGFRHEISEEEIYRSLRPGKLADKGVMHTNAKYLIEQVKKRREKDNISVILIKVD